MIRKYIHALVFMMIVPFGARTPEEVLGAVVHHLSGLRLFFALLDLIPQLELSYINTSHPDFIGGSRAISEVMDRNRTPNGGPGAGGVPGIPEVSCPT